MRHLLPLALLTGCPYTLPDDTGIPGECDGIVAEIDEELTALQTCASWDECGQVLSGTSCGCTRNLVARTDADPTRFYALLEAGSEQECDVGFESTCDCPAAYGFDCVEGTCAWDYAEGAWLPDCRAERGESYTVEGAAITGDSLVVSVEYGGGCEDHFFTLCWPDGSFMESAPVQVNLELFHEGEDPCDAWLTEEVTVSLTPLKLAYQDAYHTSAGEIVIHIGGETLSYTF